MHIVERVLAAALGLVFLVGTAPSAESADAPLNERVDRAVDRGVRWLARQQRRNGTWGPILPTGDSYSGARGRQYDFPAGLTALALHTLLKCGVAPDDPRIERGFAWLAVPAHEPVSMYEVSMVILAIEARHNPVKRERRRAEAARLRTAPGRAPDLRVKLPLEDRRWMARLLRKLVAGGHRGGWRYAIPNTVPEFRRDMSSTQMAVLAIRAAQRCGLRAEKSVLLDTLRYALDAQTPDGPEHTRWQPPPRPGETHAPIIDRARGWGYSRVSRDPTDRRESGSMTTAGLVVVLTCRDLLRERKSAELSRLEDRIERSVDDGIAWLDTHWNMLGNPGAAGHYHHLHLYGLERVGDLRRTYLLGRRDWYDEGARFLEYSQQDEGFWDLPDTHDPRRVINTCFALLFLDRATLVATTRRTR